MSILELHQFHLSFPGFELPELFKISVVVNENNQEESNNADIQFVHPKLSHDWTKEHVAINKIKLNKVEYHMPPSNINHRDANLNYIELQNGFLGIEIWKFITKKNRMLIHNVNPLAMSLLLTKIYKYQPITSAIQDITNHQLKSNNVVVCQNVGEVISELNKLNDMTSHRYMRVLDIQDCYPSLYNHLIGILSVGNTKAFDSRKDQTIWYRDLESAIMSCQKKISKGIPIGDSVFDEIANYLISRIACHVGKAVNDVVSIYGIIVVHDKFIFTSNMTDNLDQMEFLSEQILRRGLLRFNDNKTLKLDRATEQTPFEVINSDLTNAVFYLEKLIESNHCFFKLASEYVITLDIPYKHKLMSLPYLQPMLLRKWLKDGEIDSIKMGLKYARDFVLRTLIVPSVQLYWYLFVHYKLNLKLDDHFKSRLTEEIKSEYLVALLLEMINKSDSNPLILKRPNPFLIESNELEIWENIASDLVEKKVEFTDSEQELYPLFFK
eukprot:NODE_86_length_22163_cov_0.379442.p3 type:complete len:496 gc:universal NODE_86_length_22163_cov_0.379442:10065-8578(-)